MILLICPFFISKTFFFHGPTLGSYTVFYTYLTNDAYMESIRYSLGLFQVS
jgi:hypothetical protein